MRFVVVGVLGCLFASLAAGAARAEVDSRVRAFVDNWESKAKIIKALAKDDTTQIAADCAVLTDSAFDFDAMLPDALPEVWAKLKPDQQKTLVGATAKKAASDCIDRIRDYDGAPFTILGVRIADGGDRLATADVRSAGGRDMHVTWRLRPADPDRWKAVDMIVEGRSMTAGIHDRFNRLLMSRNGNLAAAIASMGDR